MNKSAIKNYAIWARNKLISDIEYKAGLMGITENPRTCMGKCIDRCNNLSSLAAAFSP